MREYKPHALLEGYIQRNFILIDDYMYMSEDVMDIVEPELWGFNSTDIIRENIGESMCVTVRNGL